MCLQFCDTVCSAVAKEECIKYYNMVHTTTFNICKQTEVKVQKNKWYGHTLVAEASQDNQVTISPRWCND
jgi:hypothetical protein